VSRAAATQACVELNPWGRFLPWSFNGYQSFVRGGQGGISGGNRLVSHGWRQMRVGLHAAG